MFRTGDAGLLEGASALAADSVVITDALGNLTTGPVSSEELSQLNGVIAPLRIPGVGMDYWGNVPPPGFVFMRGLTLGNALSGATERANADTERLFTLLWNVFPTLPVFDSMGAPVARGASAAADFAASKRLLMFDKAFKASAPPNGVHFIGESLGEENVQLTVAQMPSHTHTTVDHSHSVADPGHTHLQDPHTHVQNAHTHTQDAHNHSYTPSGTVYVRTSSRNGTIAVANDHCRAGTADRFITSTADVSNAAYSTMGSGAPSGFWQGNGDVTVNRTAVNQNTTAVNQDATAVNQDAATGLTVDTATVIVNDEGGDAYHNNVQPTIIVNYIVML